MQSQISIITPSFNSEKTIEKTILSVISQSFLWEYIIIDGGSSDKTCQIISKYADKINIFISEPDAGAYDAMNKGISRATGNIIGIINSDDWYLENTIKVVAQEFSKHPDTDILYSPINNYFNGDFVATFYPGKLENLPIRFTLNHPSCFIKKSAYNLVGLYDIQYKITADYDLILRLFLQGCKFKYVDTPLAAYSLNGMSSSTHPWDRIKLINESLRVSTQAEKKLASNLIYPLSDSIHPLSNFTFKRTKAYILWIINEIFALPIRYFLKPPTARKIKRFINKYISKLISDDYGIW